MKPQPGSLFSYNLTRAYPYRWFTPVTCIAGILLLVIFSYLNYAANGFELAVVMSSDPNTTLADVGTLSGLPRLLTAKYRPQCQPVSLSVGDTVFTNHTGLRYEIVNISQTESQELLPALTYTNNVLENCKVTLVQLELETQDRTARQWVQSAVGIVVRTSSTCRIQTPQGTISFDIANAYDLVSATATLATTNFVSQNSTTRASLWWGESIMSMNWVWSTSIAEEVRFGRDPRQDYSDTNRSLVRKADLRFFPSHNASAVDILDPYYFGLVWFFVYTNALDDLLVYYPGTHESRPAIEYIQADQYPSILWKPVDKLAKAAYSTVLVDLGQSDQSNILLDDQKLQQFTSDFQEARRWTRNVHPGPEIYTYNPSNRTGDLGTTPAVIQTTYICNVPQRKATSTIAWTIIVADLVFLRAVWTMFKLIVDSFLFKKFPHAGYCEGCRGRDHRPFDRSLPRHYYERSDDHEMSPLTKSLLRPGYRRELTEHSRL